MKRYFFVIVTLMVFLTIKAQNNNEITNDDTFSANGYGNNRQLGRSDSIQSQHKEIPRGLEGVDYR